MPLAVTISAGGKKRGDMVMENICGDMSRVVKVEERAKSNSHRIDKLEGLAVEIRAQNENIARLCAELEFTNKQLSLHDTRLCEIEKQPRARLNSLWSAVITAFLGAAIGAVITAIASLI